jgi:serine/threonine protein kinase
VAEIDSSKGDDGELLDELLGIDPRAFEDDERTQVFRSDPPPPDPSEGKIALHPREEEEAPTGIPAPVAARPLPPRPPLPVPAAPPRSAPSESALASGAAAEVPSTAERLAALPLPPPPAFAPSSPPPRVSRPASAKVHEIEPDEVEERVTTVPPEVPRAALSDVSASAVQLTEDDAPTQFVPPVAEIPSAPVSVPAARDPNDPLIGELIDGRYRVLRVLGVGGIGLVYLCQHEVLEKPVAIKVLRREYVAHDDLNERFLNEARASSAIKSPRIVDTLDVGTLPDGAPFFVMEYVEGETLAAMLDRDGAIDLPRAIDIAKQMSEGLDAAHAAGVIHRDLKPENVFLAPQPDGALFVKIFDFGIAKVARARKRLTYAGAVFGTPHYMSPEQARGDEVDQRSDLYALGVMLFEMITGNVPFDGEDPLAVMSQHVDRVPPLMSSVRGVSVPPVVEAIVSRCLAKDARDRYGSAVELLADLESIPLAVLAAVQPARSALQPVTPSKPTPSRLPSLSQPRTETLHAHVVSTTAPPGKRNRLLWGGLLAAGVVAASAVVWAARRDSGSADASSLPQQRAAAASPSSGAPSAARTTAVAPKKFEVHFVLSPIDSHLFRGEEDLGPMPVSVMVEEGSPATLTVRRKGYTTRKMVVDGSETRVVVGLLRAEPPPAVGKLQSLFKKKTK